MKLEENRKEEKYFDYDLKGWSVVNCTKARSLPEDPLALIHLVYAC